MENLFDLAEQIQMLHCDTATLSTLILKAT